MTKRDGLAIDEFSVDGHGDPDPCAKGQDQPGRRDKDGGLPIPSDDADVDFHPDEEEEEDQPDRRDQVEVGE